MLSRYRLQIYNANNHTECILFLLSYNDTKRDVRTITLHLPIHITYHHQSQRANDSSSLIVD